MNPKANYATDTQTYRYADGSVWEFHTRVNFDEIVRALSARTKKSKRGCATALRGAVKLTGRKVSPS